ncbi:hypothetical protein [Nocardia abscessus]|uniref:hypothetical protein n=1 Tax=Nocardia abscessus TaxID=120957 RepID=UPI0024557F41|nr:hypothetical protein [Nocardia abscessus]
MTGTATYIKRPTGYNGDARLYRLDPPLKYESYGENGFETSETEYVIVSALSAAFDTGDAETYIFPADENGEVTSWGELRGSIRGFYDHELALKGAGYELS